MSNKDGGAAFPSPGIVLDFSLEQTQQGAYEGMTLRDYFAAKAMQGIFANERQLLRYGNAGTTQGITTMQVVSEASYMMADAMLAVREVQK